DLLSEDKLKDVKNVIKSLQPEAEIIEAVQGKVSADRILNGRKFDYDEAMNSSIIQKVLKRNNAGQTCDDEYGITSFVFEERKPFDRDKFMTFLEENFPHGIIRSKGYIWFNDDPMHVQLMETAGRNASVFEYSNWIAAFNEKDKKDVFDNYPEVRDEWDEEYGDRLNQIVFIGNQYDKEKIEKQLVECCVDYIVED
ncbi:MAG: GTP-binding protein, partial [Eubacterium sp.]|nr:GTP-binding protein [Eubacterium sp.]